MCPKCKPIRSAICPSCPGIDWTGEVGAPDGIRTPPSPDGDKTQDSQVRWEWVAGAPDGIRTHGPQIRNLVLYPAELRAPRALLSRARLSRQSVGFESVGLTGRRNRKWQGRDFDAFFQQRCDECVGRRINGSIDLCKGQALLADFVDRHLLGLRFGG